MTAVLEELDAEVEVKPEAKAQPESESGKTPVSAPVATARQHPSLSILIPSIHARADLLASLLTAINRQCYAWWTVNGRCVSPVEVLTAIDGGQLSVGEKRNRLLNAASGDYITFVDDDDEISDRYLDEIMHAISDGERWGSGEGGKERGSVPPDIITFEVEFRNLQTRERTRFIQSLEYASGKSELKPQIVGCPPTHTAVWRREIAVRNSFPPLSYAEDWLWWQPLLQSGLVKTEHHIDWPLYVYRFDGRQSGTQKRQQREDAMAWAGPRGVDFWIQEVETWGNSDISSCPSSRHRLSDETMADCGYRKVCTCEVT